MNIVLIVLQAFQILSAIAMIGLILMQHGKGADAGATFGGGAGSASLFGASGGANFLSRSTAVLATVFLSCTLGLAYFGNLNVKSSNAGSVLESVPATQVPAAQTIPGKSDDQASKGVPAAAPTGTGANQIPGQ